MESKLLQDRILIMLCRVRSQSWLFGLGWQVRVADVAEGGRVSTRRLATHEGRAHKMALNHDAPACFLSCGEDGQVMQHDLREGRGIHRKLLVCKGRNGGV